MKIQCTRHFLNFEDIGDILTKQDIQTRMTIYYAD